MTKAIRIHETGGPEVLAYEDVEVGAPGPGEALLHQTAVGLNFIDIYYRLGLYPIPSMPVTLGVEAAGTVEAVGDGVSDIQPGDRVAYAPVLGAYAGRRLIAADRLVKLPDDVSANEAAAMMLQGLTAQYLGRRCYRIAAADTVLVHAAAGGVGLILCQWAKHLGATVIGTVGSEAKAELARRHGCDHVINYTEEDFVERVAEITGGEGLPVVYDSVGKTTFMKSLDCLRPFGLMVSFGQSSGPVEPLDLKHLAAKGSLHLTRPTLMTYAAKRADLLAGAKELFEVVGSGAVTVQRNQEYSLADTAEAHRDLESRKTTGSTILIP
ncbi:MAG: quinone oxidoreductase [Alphaproteobacteria bacterium]|nr:quinone oxidoreductase [Pseudomonadota bacterium]MCZ6483586.1 quinone oxidoreductase [Alphaproteobacteria bacterium]